MGLFHCDGCCLGNGCGHEGGCGHDGGTAAASCGLTRLRTAAAATITAAAAASAETAAASARRADSSAMAVGLGWGPAAVFAARVPQGVSLSDGSCLSAGSG